MAEWSGGRFEFGVLGPLEIGYCRELVDPGPHKQRVLLGLLLCRANSVVPVEELLHAVWPEGRPRTARKNLQVYVSALRKLVGDRLHHMSYGYQLRVARDELDVLVFESLVAAGHVAHHDGDLDAAGDLLGRAIGLWRDDALVDLRLNPVIAAESERLGERYIAVYEDWADLEIEQGRHLPILGKLVHLARRHPFRERLTAAAMTALNRGGRRSEALATFETHRQFVARELGLNPSPILQQLYRTILAAEAVPVPAMRQRLRPAQLPRDVPDLVGRTAEVNHLVGALAGGGRTDVAVVSGTAGAGKTALAVRAGHRMAGQFSDGQIIVSLRAADGLPRRTEDVLAELLHATGLTIPVPAEPADAHTVWRSWVADREFLFILDDATSEAQVRWLLPGSGGSRTLLTSSLRLSGLESVCRVEIGELTHDEVVEVLTTALGEARMRDAGDAVARMMARCGGTPGAIRAVAMKLGALRHVSPAAFADRLDETHAVLDELSVGDLPVRARMRRLWCALPSAQQEALRVLSALPEPPRHAEAVAAMDGLGEPAGRLIEALIEANLVDAELMDTGHVRYSVPALVRRYALEQ